MTSQPPASNPLTTRFPRRRRPPPGAPPGTMMPVPDAEFTELRVMAYGPAGLVEEEGSTIERIAELMNAWPVTWVDVEGLGDLDLIRGLGQLLGLHPLALEDVVHLHQRAKMENYGDYLFLITRMAMRNHHLQTEQLSMFLGQRFVVTFQHIPGDPLDPVRARLRHGVGNLRQSGPDYLVYALLDAIIDHYFPVLESYGDELEDLEEAVVEHTSLAVRNHIHDIRQDLRTLRRAIWPQRDALNQLLHDPSQLVSAETQVYLRDAQDHTTQLMDLVETYRELGSDLMDLYLSSVSNRMNEIMKVLTIISTIFIPLSFVAGVYGMNFNPGASPLNMPELNWFWGYPFALGVMATVASLLLLYFRRRQWF